MSDLSRALALALLCLTGATGCRAKQPEAKTTASRVDSVHQASAAGFSSFCDRSYPASGPGARRWQAPADKPIPGLVRTATAGTAGWTWLNLWATWCAPCLAELPLLESWRESLSQDGVPIHLELWSIDEDERALTRAASKPLPEHLRWLANPKDLPIVLDRLGIDRASAIPVHALIDRAGMIRCVRVGSLREEAYGAVKSMIGAP